MLPKTIQSRDPQAFNALVYLWAQLSRTDEDEARADLLGTYDDPDGGYVNYVVTELPESGWRFFNPNSGETLIWDGVKKEWT